MSLLSFVSIIELLPCIYPVSKFIRKKELNLIDFVLLFYNLNFAFTPLTIGSDYTFYDDNIVFNFFCYYIIFDLLLLFVDIWWTKHHGKSLSVINFTKILANIGEFRISKLGYVLIFIIYIVTILIYIPNASYVVRADDVGIENPNIKSFVIAFSTLFSVLGAIIFLVTLDKKKKNQLSLMDILIIVTFFICCVFMLRRFFLMQIIVFGLLFYSQFRNIITLKNTMLSALVIILFINVYFPFYNVIRWNPYTFDINNPITSLTDIITYGLDNYEQNKALQAASSRERSMGLYQSMYNCLKNFKTFDYGKTTLMDIDVAIPKVINSNKGNGSEEYLAKKTGTFKDQADNLLMLSYSDFGFLGSFYSVFLLIITFFVYGKYARFLYRKPIKLQISPIIITITLFSFTWNVEGKLSSIISWFFSSVFLLLLLWIFEKCQIFKISYKNDMYK